MSKKMSKKKLIYMIVAAVLVVVCIISAIVMSLKGSGEPKEKETTPLSSVQTDEKTPEEVEIPLHRDNEEDKQPEVIRITKGLAEDFVKSYITLLPKDHHNFLLQIQPYAEEQLYTYLTYQTPVEQDFQRKVIELQSTPVDDILENRKKWQLIAFVEVKKDSGSKLEKQMQFQVSVALKDQQWVVTGFEVNE